MISIKLQHFIGGLIIFIFLIILVFKTPFYNKSFDQIRENIQETKQIITYSQINLNKSDGLIIIDGQTKQYIKINKGLNYLGFEIYSGQKISFPTKSIYSGVYLYIQINDNFLKLYPQSAIYIKHYQTINIINGIVQYINLNNNSINFEGTIKAFELSKNDQILTNILEQLFLNQKQYVIQIYGGNIILNRTYDSIISKLLNIFSKISPKNFKDNLENYNKFKIYIKTLDIKTNQNTDLNFQNQEKVNIKSDIIQQFKKGLSKTINSF